VKTRILSLLRVVLQGRADMFYRSFTVFMLIFLISCSASKPKNGFDSICYIFEKASTKKLNPEELGRYIATELDTVIEGRPVSQDIKEVYYALFNVNPVERYGLFKESAESALKRRWDCEAMKAQYHEK